MIESKCKVPMNRCPFDCVQMGMSRIRNIRRNIKKWISILCIRKNLEGLSRVQIDDRIVYIYLERK